MLIHGCGQERDLSGAERWMKDTAGRSKQRNKDRNEKHGSNKQPSKQTKQDKTGKRQDKTKHNKAIQSTKRCKRKQNKAKQNKHLDDQFKTPALHAGQLFQAAKASGQADLQRLGHWLEAGVVEVKCKPRNIKLGYGSKRKA